jgi:hypothetical protein
VKIDGQIEAMRADREQSQIALDGDMAKQLEDDRWQRLPSPPDDNVQGALTAIRAVENADEAKDQANQEEAKLDLRLIGWEGLTEVGQDGLVVFAQKTLSETLDRPKRRKQRRHRGQRGMGCRRQSLKNNFLD